MTRKRTVRRVWATINPIEHAMYQASKLTAKEWNEQIIPVQSAVDRLSMGDWHEKECWQPLFECLNRVESIVELNRLDDHGFITEAQTAMVDALDRKAKTGAQALRATELAALRDLVANYGGLLKELSHGQFAKACAHTNANITRILNHKDKMKSVAGCVFEMKKSIEKHPALL